MQCEGGTSHMYLNAGGSTIVRGLKNDLPREVMYNRTGCGTVYYEPLHKQYHVVRNRMLEITEIAVLETMTMTMGGHRPSSPYILPEGEGIGQSMCRRGEAYLDHEDE